MSEFSLRKLEWTLTGPGSAKFSWETEGEKVEIHTSYLGNALDGLLLAALDLRLGSSATMAILLGEPGGHRIFFSGAEERVYVQIVRFDDLFTVENRWKGGELRWHGRVPTTDVIDGVRKMAERVLDHYGSDGYSKLWKSPYPHDLLNRLQARR